MADMADGHRSRDELTFAAYLRAEPLLDGELEIERIREFPRDDAFDVSETDERPESD